MIVLNQATDSRLAHFEAIEIAALSELAVIVSISLNFRLYSTSGNESVHAGLGRGHLVDVLATGL